MLRWLAFLALITVGCSRDPAPAPSAAPAVASAGAIEFDGRTWEPGEFTNRTGDVFRPSMLARIFTTNNPDERLLEFTLDSRSALQGEGVFKRMLVVQVKRDGQWVRHGKTADWDKDGSYGDADYFDGQLHGQQRAWYPNGQLHFDQQFAFGKQHGPSRGWYENGKPQFEAIMQNDVEVSGVSWDENGKVRP